MKSIKGIKRGCITLLCGVLLTSMLTGCSGKDGKTSKNAEVPFAPKLDTQTDCEITVVGHYSNFEALEEEFNRFTEFYPNVKMNYTYLDNYNGIIATALTSNEAPDIFFTYPWMANQAKEESVLALAEDLSDPSLGINLSCIRENLLYKDEEGHVPTVPVYTTTYGMMVNESIFEKEGLSIPKTYDELISVCDALKKAGYSSPVMAYNRGSFMLFPLYYPYFCAQIQGNEKAIQEMNDMKPGAGEYVRDTLEKAADFMGRGYVDLESCNALENDYQAVILRFFEGDVPMMFASGNTVSGTEKRESQSESFSAHPFSYSFHHVPSTEEGGYFLNAISVGFAVNKNSANLEMTNEFMRFLVSTQELGRMARAKRMVTPCVDMSFDGVYAAFGELDAKHIVNLSELGLADTPDSQVRRAGWQVSNFNMTVDEAVKAFGTLE